MKVSTWAGNPAGNQRLSQRNIVYTISLCAPPVLVTVAWIKFVAVKSWVAETAGSANTVSVIAQGVGLCPRTFTI